MDRCVETVRVTLEDLGPTSWWAGLVSTVTWQTGHSLQRFVACQDGRRRCTSPTFVAPRSHEPVPPQDAWTPAMTRSFHALCRRLERDGWVRNGAGAVPWAFTYERPVSPARTSAPASV